jgi:GDP-mannose 6-dehydrogenase
MDLNLPVLSAILPSNELQIERGLRLVQDKGRRRIGVLGFSFKAGTDDLRESPVVEVVERLIGKGYDVKLFDHNVNVARLIGANKGYILDRIPHISRLMAESVDQVLAHSEVIVVGNRSPEFADAIRRVDSSVAIVDLVRICEEPGDRPGYEGICW